MASAMPIPVFVQPKQSHGDFYIFSRGRIHGMNALPEAVWQMLFALILFAKDDNCVRNVTKLSQKSHRAVTRMEYTVCRNPWKGLD